MGNFVIFSPSFDSPYKELGDAVGQVEMSAFSTPMAWRWFNPETGQSQAGQGDAENRGQRSFERPADWGDALLVLRRPANIR